MTEQEAHPHAEALAYGMGITIYVVCTREGDFQPVQQPPDDCEIVATFALPDSVGRQFDRDLT